MNPNHQNIYETQDAFSTYLRYRGDDRSLNRTLEMPTTSELLPAVAGRRCLDLGCGTGELARDLAEQGAHSVLGVDISQRMVDHASAQPCARAEVLNYCCAPMDEFESDGVAFDLVVSSLAIHYVPELGPLFERVVASMPPGACFVFSVEHPVLTATYPLRSGQPPQMRYNADQTRRYNEWLVKGVEVYHRTFSTYFKALHDCGLAVDAIAEPIVGPVQDNPIPPFLFIRAFRK